VLIVGVLGITLFGGVLLGIQSNRAEPTQSQDDFLQPLPTASQLQSQPTNTGNAANVKASGVPTQSIADITKLGAVDPVSVRSLFTMVNSGIVIPYLMGMYPHTFLDHVSFLFYPMLGIEAAIRLWDGVRYVPDLVHEVTDATMSLGLRRYFAHQAKEETMRLMIDRGISQSEIDSLYEQVRLEVGTERTNRVVQTEPTPLYRFLRQNKALYDLDLAQDTLFLTRLSDHFIKNDDMKGYQTLDNIVSAYGFSQSFEYLVDEDRLTNGHTSYVDRYATESIKTFFSKVYHDLIVSKFIRPQTYINSSMLSYSWNQDIDSISKTYEREQQ
jgi:hypothetical protein